MLLLVTEAKQQVNEMPYITCENGKTYSTHDNSQYVSECKSSKQMKSTNENQVEGEAIFTPEIAVIFLISLVVGFVLPFIFQCRK